MKIKIFGPKSSGGENYAIAVPTPGHLEIIKTYFNIEETELGYSVLRAYAELRGLKEPIPVEKVDNKCKVLENLISNYKSN